MKISDQLFFCNMFVLVFVVLFFLQDKFKLVKK